MAELPELRLGSQLINSVAVGDKLMGWNDILAVPTTTTTTTSTTTTTQPPVPPTPSELAANFITASGITDSTQITAVTNLVNDLSSSALLDKMYVIYPFVGGTSTAHSYNLMDTGSYQLSFAGTWVHDANGVTSNGTNAYADTFFRPGNADSTDWLTSGSMGLYSRTSGAEGYDMGSSRTFGGPGTQTAILIKFNANNNFYPGLPVGVAQYSGSVDGAGFYAASRLGTNVSGYIDGSQVSSQVDTSYRLPTFNMVIGAFRDQFSGITGYSARNYAYAYIGKGLTSAEQSSLYTIVQDYETTLSRQI